MIPPFDDVGNLPPGVHRATLEEIEARFGTPSEVRRAQMDSVRWMIKLARQVGVRRIILNGSFVSDIIEPIDVDCVLLVIESMVVDPTALEELELGLPFLSMVVADEIEFDEYVNVFFASDRFSVPKGIVEIIL